LDPFIDALLGLAPVWLVITPLVGVVNGTLFFLIVGRRPNSLLIYVTLAILAASVEQALGLVAADSPPFSLGDVHLIATTVAAWVALAIARAVGF